MGSKNHFIELYVDDQNAGFDVTADMADCDSLTVIDTGASTSATVLSVNICDDFLRAVISKMPDASFRLFTIYVLLHKIEINRIVYNARRNGGLVRMPQSYGLYHGVDDLTGEGGALYVDSHGENLRQVRTNVKIEIRSHKRTDGSNWTTVNTMPYFPLKLASHDSFTYGKPSISVGNEWLAKCQSLDLQGQYRLGVRMFDLRVRQAGTPGDPVAAHGLVTYDVDVRAQLRLLNTLPDVWVRLRLENLWRKKERTKDYDWFHAFVSDAVRHYPQIRFFSGHARHSPDAKWQEHKVAQFLPDGPLFAAYTWNSGMSGIPYPKKYAQDNNWINKKHLNYSTWSMFDFVELLFE